MNPRILVIQTSPRASGLADLLASSPYEVTRAATQAAALRQAFGDAPPDLVLLDVDRADAQVLELIRLLKARSQPRFVPVLVLSAEGALETRVAALRAGADDFLRPTLHPAETLARIAAMLRIQASQDRLQEATAALVEQSVTDHLTGLYNRRHFQERLTQELSRARRYGSPLSLLLMDLDHFKHVNDRFGHQAGDVALRQTAALVRPALRTLDLCARLGGEEFAVIMPTTDGAGALTVAERLRHAIAAAPLLTATEIMKPGVNPVEVRITASFGVSCLAGGSSRSGA